MIEQAHDKASSSLTARKESFDRKANRAGNEKHKISKVSRLIQSCVLVLLGMLYSCAFPGVDWYILGWIGLAPLAAWAMLVTPQRAFRAGLYWGFGWAISAFFWIREIELFLPVPLALYLALYPALWAWAIPYFKKQIFIPNNVQLQGYEAIQSYENPSVWKDIIFCLILACWWCILEWTRSWLMTGFPWNFVAVTQWKNSPLIQIAEYTGTYGVSFIVVFMNLSLVMAVILFVVQLDKVAILDR